MDTTTVGVSAPPRSPAPAINLLTVLDLLTQARRAAAVTLAEVAMATEAGAWQVACDALAAQRGGLADLEHRLLVALTVLPAGRKPADQPPAGGRESPLA